ncbi:MAG TPA: hypothetical protein VND93_04465 [Myxococcales bacterium]|nr:hypothetical protein [Myxococcales bacterium]
MISMTAVTTAVWLLGSGAVDWTATFPPEAMGSYVEADASAVLVAPAGDASADLAGAAKAVAAALRASGKAKLVMDESAIGATAGLSDEQIVQKCKALPVQRVVVVRVFPGADAARPSAVITFYDKDARAVSALAAEAGTPVAAREGKAEGGISGSTLNAVGNVTQSRPGDKNAQQKYDEQYIWFADLTGVNQYGQVVGTWSFAYEGKYQKLLTMDQLLIKVGRQDLARDYAAKNSQKSLLVITGGAALIASGGLLPLALLSACAAKSAQNYDCVRYDWTNTALVGGLAAGGLGLMIWGFGIKMPVEPVEVRKMADEYNQKLKRDLGLSAREREGGPSLQISLAPTGLSLSGTF